MDLSIERAKCDSCRAWSPVSLVSLLIHFILHKYVNRSTNLASHVLWESLRGGTLGCREVVYVWWGHSCESKSQSKVYSRRWGDRFWIRIISEYEGDCSVWNWPYFPIKILRLDYKVNYIGGLALILLSRRWNTNVYQKWSHFTTFERSRRRKVPKLDSVLLQLSHDWGLPKPRNRLTAVSKRHLVCWWWH